ncbi:MAG: hypothetical protein KDA84_28145 [Planctomycetaceae bacterium]|nr:hypothetical protein [Planctomycetaceae bacterium]
MLRNIENLNSVALILSDLNIGLVAATGSAAHDLRLRERFLDLSMEEFPGRPMLGKRPADPMPDTKRTYPGGGGPDCADTLCPATSASARTSERRETAMCSTGIHQRCPKTHQQRHQHWRRSSGASVSSWDVVVVPVSCSAFVSV